MNLPLTSVMALMIFGLFFGFKYIVIIMLSLIVFNIFRIYRNTMLGFFFAFMATLNIAFAEDKESQEIKDDEKIEIQLDLIQDTYIKISEYENQKKIKDKR